MSKTIEFIPSIDFTEGTFKDVPLLYHEGYKSFRTSKMDWVFTQYGLFKYFLRHSDDGDFVLPVTIEDCGYIMVNYCGFIISPVNLMEEFKDRVEFDNCIILTHDEGYDIIGGEYIDFEEYLKNIEKDVENG